MQKGIDVQKQREKDHLIRHGDAWLWQEPPSKADTIIMPVNLILSKKNLARMYAIIPDRATLTELFSSLVGDNINSWVKYGYSGSGELYMELVELGHKARRKA